MVAPVYSTDLATVTADTTKGTIYRQDSTSALTTTGCLGTLTHAEPTGSTAGGSPAQDTDYFILGVATADKSFNATGVGGLGVTSTNAASVPTDGAIFVWGMFTCPNSVSVKSSGGIQVVVGSTVANYKRYYVAGEDSHPYGGWKCYPVSYTLATNNTTIIAQGTPGVSPAFFGMAYNVDNAVARGNPAALGAVRFGRGYIICEGGDITNGYATFTGAGTFNDYNDATNGWNRLGLLQYSNGSYQQQGLFQMGSTATAVDFRDSNKSIVIQNTEFVTTNFNTFEVKNAASRVDWTGISITSLSIVSRGIFLATDNADINKDSCTFTDMGTFTYQSNSTINNSVYRRCDRVTQGGAVIYNTVFDNPFGTVALLVGSSSNTVNVTYSDFISDGTGHALEITGTAADCTLTFINFSGYAATNGSTGNEAIFVNIASGTMTININGGTTPTIRTAGCTVIVSNSKTKTFTNIPSGAEIRIKQGSYTLAYSDPITTGSYPYSYQTDNKVVRCVVTLAGYIIDPIDFTQDSISQSIAIVYSPDPSYVA